MKVLVLGTPGQLGHELMRASWPIGVSLAGVGHPDFDMSLEKDVLRVVAEYDPNLVINATAYTAVDKAEKEPELAFAVNRDGPRFLAQDCARRGIPVIHVSTDYVFDGTKDGWYVEEDPIAPLNVYGASKAAGELEIREIWHRHVILRTTWVYAAHGTNFVKKMLHLGAERETLSVVADQYGAPTAAADLAATITSVVAHIAQGGKAWGTYHATGSGETTWHGFAEHIFQRLEQETGRRPILHAITTDNYPTPARRPKNSRLDCTKLKNNFDIVLPHWQKSLDRVIDELFALSSRQERRS
ncbi:dTDP-4-dehydrorhamnose reductase [Pararhodospirillum photometricum]|nr:dTDP-4-dehydrorhamnose reductase [Pararhodospirillum photometricum]